MSLSCAAFSIGGQLAVTPYWAAFDRAIATRGWLRCKGTYRTLGDQRATATPPYLRICLAAPCAIA